MSDPGNRSKEELNANRMVAPERSGRGQEVRR